MKQLALESPTGARLNVRYLEAAGAPRAIVQINHGMAEHCARYEAFMAHLAANGFAAIAHDHRGHGLTTAPDAPLGQFAKSNGLEKVLEDVLAINQWARARWQEVPLVCFGHSMGGIVAGNFALRHYPLINGLAIWNIGFEGGLQLSALRNLLKWERWRKGSDVPSLLAKKLTFDTWNARFKPTRTDFDWLSRDGAEVDKYVADPLCGFAVSNGLWLEVLAGIAYVADDNHLLELPRQLPIHLLAGSADPSTLDGTAMRRFYGRLLKNRQSDVTLCLLQGARHESLNETNRDQVMADFVTWLNERYAK